MAERFTDKVMRRIEGERIRTRDERVMFIDELPDILEAAKLEQGVFVEFYKPKGNMYEAINGKETVSLTVPEESVVVRVHSVRPNLTTFWNTFDALREYNQPTS